jgi:hypothetical protein
MRLSIVLVTTILLFLLIGCQQNKSKNIPKVSNIEVLFDVFQFDQELASLDTLNLSTSFAALESQHPGFTALYFTRIVPIPSYKNQHEKFLAELNQMRRTPSISAIRDSVHNHFPAETMDKLYESFEQSFKFYQHYFPQRDVPDIYTFISEFGYAAFIFESAPGEDAIGIGLDMFLGPTFPYEEIAAYDNAFAEYLVRTYNPDHLVKKAIDAIIDDLTIRPRTSIMLDQLIYEGKKQYLLDRLLPAAEDSVKWELTPAQYDWLKSNEWNIWTYLINEDLLYSNRPSTYLPLLKTSPHSKGMPPEAPGRAVVYIGRAIVEAYMKRHPEMSLTDMLKIENGQSFLENAKYKPIQ